MSEVQQLQKVHDLGRNDPCHCGSGKKYKKCCLSKDQAAESEARAKAAEQASDDKETAETPPEQNPKKHPTPPKPTAQPWKRTAQNAQTFQRHNIPQKRGNS